jgi:hypothetical protein
MLFLGYVLPVWVPSPPFHIDLAKTNIYLPFANSGSCNEVITYLGGIHILLKEHKDEQMEGEGKYG